MWQAVIKPRCLFKCTCYESCNCLSLNNLLLNQMRYSFCEIHKPVYILSYKTSCSIWRTCDKTFGKDAHKPGIISLPHLIMIVSSVGTLVPSTKIKFELHKPRQLLVWGNLLYTYLTLFDTYQILHVSTHYPARHYATSTFN